MLNNNIFIWRRSGVIGIYSIAESSAGENSKLNGHANGSAGGSPAEAEVEPSSDETKRAFLSLEPDEKGQAKASVTEVFKKVIPPAPFP